MKKGLACIKLSSLMIGIIVLSIILITSSDSVYAKNITAKDAQAQKGQSEDVEVVIDNPNSVAGVQLKLKYDASKLEYQSHVIGLLFADWNPQVVVSPGVVSLAAASATPLSQTTEANIITVTFKAIGNVGDIVPLILEDIYLSDGDGNLLPVQTQDGEFIITGAQADKNITAMDAEAPKGQNGDVRVVIDNPNSVAGVQLKLKYDASKLEYQSHVISPLFAGWNPRVVVFPGVVSLAAASATPLSQTTEANIITVTFKAIENVGDIVPLLLEDVYLSDGDGNLLPVQTHDGEFTISCPLVGDVSGNGIVTAYDAALILQFVVGIIDEFPVQPSPITNTPQSYSITVPRLTVATGNKIQAPIIINDASGVTSGGITLRYDPKVLRAVNVVSSSLLSGHYWQFNTKLDGEVRIAFVGNRIISGDGVLFYVEFEILPKNIGKVSPLILETAQISENLDITKVNGSIAVLPTKSTLLQNYPNPFNPETWVPYLLVEPANATLKIYSAAGKLVRTLDLGYKDAGIYLSKDKAAYWDGKDERGESVASGVYFYTLQAENLTVTRKMVIVR